LYFSMNDFPLAQMPKSMLQIGKY